MTISLANTAPRHERRFRLIFSEAVAAGAFTSTSYYTVTSQDSLGVSPNVLAAIPVPGSPNVVELALDADLVGGGLYLAEADGVPAAGGSFTPTPSNILFRFASPPVDTNVEQTADDLGALLYGRDVAHDGNDYIEGPDGDLVTLSGPENAHQAIARRVLADGLMWDDSYGAKPRQYVDGPNQSTMLRGALIRQCRADDRVRDVKVARSVDTSANADPGAFFYNLDVLLIGDDQPARVKVQVPTSTSTAGS